MCSGGPSGPSGRFLTGSCPSLCFRVVLRLVSVPQSSQVDDPPHTRRLRGIGEVGRSFSVLGLEVPGGITDAPPQSLGPPGQAAHQASRIFQTRE
jgi:hypothetical protein